MPAARAGSSPPEVLLDEAELPAEAHDIAMTAIVTEAEIVRPRRPR